MKYTFSDNSQIQSSVTYKKACFAFPTWGLTVFGQSSGIINQPNSTQKAWIIGETTKLARYKALLLGKDNETR